MRFLAWVLSLFFAFNLGARGNSPARETDEELRNRVQEHIDVIVDEGAAIVDEIAEEIRNDERVQDAEQFVQDVQEVAGETLEELNQVLEDAKDRVEEKFGLGERDEGEKDPEWVAEPTPAAPMEQEQPGPDDPING